MKRSSYLKNEQPTLYVCATPIGNLSEINQRLIATLQEVDIILCEDTRVSIKLLNHLSIKGKQLESFHQHNEYDKSQEVINLLLDNKKIALISDAGYPLLSDPGSNLVTKAIAQDINVVVINGSNALLPALITSGFSTIPFTFIGFLPPKTTKAIALLTQFKNYKHTLVLYESIHRINKTLQIIHDVLGDVELVITREITKLNEEKIYGRVSELIASNLVLKGELVIVINNNQVQEEVIDDHFIITKVDDYIKRQYSTKEAIKQVVNEYDLERNYVYNLYHQRTK
ncbi:MAG: 16S rRNA (cytidine(1402)-2'-O)-methyltransferase [Bacilli bacterium]